MKKSIVLFLLLVCASAALFAGGSTDTTKKPAPAVQRSAPSAPAAVQRPAPSAPVAIQQPTLQPKPVNSYLAGDGEEDMSLAAIQNARTVSNLKTEGTPVDVSPYLLNSLSTVTRLPSNPYVSNLNNQPPINTYHSNTGALAGNAASSGLQTASNIAGKASVATGAAALGVAVVSSVADKVDKYQYYEFDVLVTFKDAKKMEHSFERTYAVCARGKGKAKNSIEDHHALRDAAEYLGLDDSDKKQMKTITKFDVKYLSDTRESETKYADGYSPVFRSEIERCTYQFDVQVRFEKEKASKKNPAVYETFDKIYESPLRTLGAAAIDVQNSIWEDAQKKGYKKTPLPVVNFVQTIKVLPQQKGQNNQTAQTANIQSTNANGSLQYFVSIESKPSGPFSLAKLKEMAQTGQLGTDSLVWKEGMPQWVEAGGVAELNSVFTAGAPPLPPR
ncbi:MAG: GYF domain-containing protein [Spirochaetaceae bacterium]|jgi:hypothetical protein|nr:GYF domain-containing protein [Spirochaetaceae bacterium]